MSDPLEPIPATHRDAARAAFDLAFCGTPVASVTRMPGGMSGALVYQVAIDDHDYLLRIVTNPNAMNDPARQFATMAIAAGDGIAPRVIHADPVHGMVITDFVRAIPWHLAFAENTSLFATFGAQLRRLHDGPAFPAFVTAFQAIDGGLDTLARAGVTLSPLVLEFLDRFAAVRHLLEPRVELRPCHNDLNPGNLLFDGARLWIVDWESAWQNDPMFDIATLLHWFGFEGEREALLLEGYFAGPPPAYDTAKLELMRSVVACYYGIVFHLLSLQLGQLPLPLSVAREDLPAFAAARQLLRTGALPLQSADDRTRFALIMIVDALHRMQSERFAKAAEVVLTEN